MAIIREVMQTMLNSKEFWSAGRLSHQDEVAAGDGGERGPRGERRCGFRLRAGNQVAHLGEPLYRKQEPTGYSNSSEEWMNSAGLMARMNFALQLADNKVPGVKVDRRRRSWRACIPDRAEHSER